MKVNRSIIQLRRFEVEEKRRQIRDIEAMIEDFERMVADLQRQIDMEQQRSGITDVNHYNYPTFAKAALQRRNNLQESIEGLTKQLATARQELANAEEELAKLEVEMKNGTDSEATVRKAKSPGRQYANAASIAPIPMSARSL